MNDLLKIVADNPALSAALRELLMKQFGNDSVLEASMTDEQIGQITRARLAGIDKIEAAFKEIERFRSVPVREQSPNPAR